LRPALPGDGSVVRVARDDVVLLDAVQRRGPFGRAAIDRRLVTGSLPVLNWPYSDVDGSSFQLAPRRTAVERSVALWLPLAARKS
jgi:hypothetical protein